MSYAICRMQKMKSHDLKGMQFHNQRERESRTNPDIDQTKSHLNVDLVNEEKIDYNKRVKEIIESQKITDRKTRKDAVLVNELMITSDREFFDRLPEEDHQRFFEKSYEWLAERYGQQNVAYAVVHNDEKTPHMHMGVVPMRDGKLQGKNVFNRKELQALQDDFPQYLKKQQFQLERGKKGSDVKHLRTQDFKAKTLEEQVQSLEGELNDKQAEKQEVETSIQDIKGRLDELGASLDKVKRVDDIQVKEGGLFGSQTVKLSREDYEGIQTLAKSSETLRHENKALQNENQQLKEDKQKLQKKNDRLQEQASLAERYKRERDRLANLIQKIHNFYKKRLPEATKTFEHVMGYCKQVLNRSTKNRDLPAFRKDNLTKHEQDGFDQGIQEVKQKRLNKNRGMER
ncbi:MobV family relaxase [Halobacillus hunanensis]|uniref:MobV family relaxase n=1 Tax=Halobacillus hunanensis TaxID=578214 RepID=UPI001116D9F1|nr:MobV family relaxase [Halobacillus hunanensis]